MFDLGFDDDDLAGLEDELGAARRSYGGRRAIARAPRRSPIARLVPKVPGVPPAAVRQYALGFGAGQFAAATATTLTLTARPQLPFQGRRLVIAVTRTGATATGLLTVTQLIVGQQNQLVSAAALPADMFLPGAFQTELALSPATPGIDVTIQVAISALPAAADTVDFSVALIGPTIS